LSDLAQLSFEERQAIAPCLISKVVVTGEEVDVHFLLPFDSTPQVAQPFGQKIETLYGKRTWRENLATCHHMETS
jgi:hypothetical protein